MTQVTFQHQYCKKTTYTQRFHYMQYPVSSAFSELHNIGATRTKISWSWCNGEAKAIAMDSRPNLFHYLPSHSRFLHWYQITPFSDWGTTVWVAFSQLLHSSTRPASV